MSASPGASYTLTTGQVALQLIGAPAQEQAWWKARFFACEGVEKITAFAKKWGLRIMLDDERHRTIMRSVFPSKAGDGPDFVEWTEWRWPWEDGPDIVGTRGFIPVLNEGEALPIIHSTEVLALINGFQLPAIENAGAFEA